MHRRIAIVQGNPSPTPTHFGHALADAYAAGATEANHEVRRTDVATLSFPFLTSKKEYETGPLPPGLVAAQATIGWADHLVFIFPLWLGTMPAILKGFLEQVFRPGFALTAASESETGWPKKLLQQKSARLVVTMGMPAFWYRWYYLAHGVRGMERNILRFCGIDPIRETFIGMVETKRAGAHDKWLKKMHRLGRTGS
ncbi:MAG TPA: NAD(P)H-dependent oxidoreductase [Opitutus sp.]|nr:NAD(P)H-dependent oxidoreductase [Opitutus sp.]